MLRIMTRSSILLKYQFIFEMPISGEIASCNNSQYMTPVKVQNILRSPINTSRKIELFWMLRVHFVHTWIAVCQRASVTAVTQANSEKGAFIGKSNIRK